MEETWTLVSQVSQMRLKSTVRVCCGGGRRAHLYPIGSDFGDSRVRLCPWSKYLYGRWLRRMECLAPFLYYAFLPCILTTTVV